MALKLNEAMLSFVRKVPTETSIPNGEYSGCWSEKVVEFWIGNDVYIGHADTFAPSPGRVPCGVTVDGPNITAVVKINVVDRAPVRPITNVPAQPYTGVVTDGACGVVNGDPPSTARVTP